MQEKLLKIGLLMKVHKVLMIIIKNEQYCGLEAQALLEPARNG